jgi:hypothetical protein
MLRRLALSVAAAVLTLVFFIVCTFVTSRNWIHDGPDTVFASLFSLPWEWSFMVAGSTGAVGWAFLGIVLALPVLSYSVVYFTLFTAVARIRAFRRS